MVRLVRDELVNTILDELTQLYENKGSGPGLLTGKFLDLASGIDLCILRGIFCELESKGLVIKISHQEDDCGSVTQNTSWRINPEKIGQIR